MKDSSSAVVDENFANNTESTEQASDYSNNASSTNNLTLNELESQNETDSTVHENVTKEEEEDDDEEVSLSRLSVDYASKSAGALIIEKSSGFKGTSNLLNSDKDKYAIAPCEEKKFVVISLSEDILVKQIKLSNYERFSSSVKDFQVMGSQTLGKWFDLGTYSAKSGNGEQVFDLAEPAWARYLKFKFLSHHGVEYYCTYSQIQVHGSTMVQGFHEQWEESEENENDELVAENSSHVGVDSSTKESNSSTTNNTDISVEDATIDISKKSQTKAAKTSFGTDVDAPQSGGVEAVPRGSQSSQLEDKLRGTLADQELFASLYDLIPSTLSALPLTSRDSPGRQTTGGELRTLHQLGSLAIQSIFAAPKPSGDAAEEGNEQNARSSISTPRMSDKMGDTIGHYLKTELGLLTSRWMYPDPQEPILKSMKHAVDLTKNNTEPKMDNESDTISDEDLKTKTNVSKDVSEPGEKETEDDSELNKVDVKNLSEMQHDSPQSKGSNLSPTGSSTEYSIDVALAKMLEDLPSAECLHQLDFSDFKAKLNTPRKSASGQGTSTSGGPNQMEPIFKKLTDEIRSLQSNLQVHDQFAKLSAACYQRVLLDLIVATDQLRSDHDERLRKLEKKFRESQHNFVWKFSRTLLQALRSVALWMYSTIIHVYYPLIIWCSCLGKGCLRIPGMIYRYVLFRWPTVKTFLLTNKDGSTSGWAELLLPVTDLIDQLLVEMKVADSNFTPEEADSLARETDEMWKFPVLPIVLLILMGRIVMCFANNPSVRVSKFSTGGSPGRWKSLASSPSKTVMSKGVSSSTKTKTLQELTPSEHTNKNNETPLSSSSSGSGAPSPFRRSDKAAADHVTKPNLSMEPPSEAGHQPQDGHPSPTNRISRIPVVSRRSGISPRNGTTIRVTP